MAALQPLQALNKSSAPLATFAVRLSGGRVVKYAYTSKKDQKAVTAYKFEACLVGNSPQDYCIGFVKGSEAECNQAKMKYTNDTVWSLSKVSLDSYTAGTYISTPIPFRVDLTKSKMTIRDADDEPDIQLRASMPQHPVPPRSVADVSRITTSRCTDLIAMIKEVSTNKRQSKSGEEIVDFDLVDNSKTTSDKLAVIVVSVFGAGKIQQLTHEVGKPVAFFNLSVDCKGRPSTTTVARWWGLRPSARRPSPCARRKRTSPPRRAPTSSPRFGPPTNRGT